MRITDSMNTSTMTSYLLKNRDELYRLQEQTSSGKKVQYASDDPAAYSRISSMYTQQSRITQFNKNTTQLDGDLLTMDANLQNVHDKLKRVSEITIQGGDSSKNPNDLIALGEEVDQYLESLVGNANTHPGESYIYSGLRQDTPAYEIVRDDEGRISEVNYQGSDQTRMVEIGENDYVPGTLVGSDMTGDNGVFQTNDNDVFADLILIRDRLLAGTNLAQEDAATADEATGTLTVSDIYATGGAVSLSTDGTLPSGLDADTTYYAIRISDTEIKLADSLENARAGIALSFTDAGTGDLKVTQEHQACIEKDTDQVIDVLTRLGAYEERVSANKSVLLTKSNQLNIRLEDEESIDIAKAAMELSEKQTAYEAAMRATMTTMNSSLLSMM
ncbi:MAG: flagellar hook-associated protein 3 [Spartobacteria bacterium]|nr:flagellar hook-associated protein 3 [Spartobacteria bacterium]